MSALHNSRNRLRMTLKFFLTNGNFLNSCSFLSLDFSGHSSFELTAKQTGSTTGEHAVLPQTHPHSLSSNNWHISTAAFLLTGPFTHPCCWPSPSPNRTGVITLQIRSRRLTYKPNDSLTLLCAKFRQRAFRPSCHCTNLRPRIDARLLHLSQTPRALLRIMNIFYGY